ncbi:MULTISPECIES: septal ring lytic transglycosylase RlpA family protein [unclassified Pseudoxanthomonas]|uniref:septal ring lytic transglycosylase RlpA family protein n=1 Tax=unclassified Pseudoxanthomonas TaxID=2645906 RepID=UPI0016130EF2|nr:MULTISPECIES: septal ring lytic transglycosylase RlpA family protein [unclassified Pseudoxanthomonas]MBB3275772.1 rare lipoprotein A [Pseudoxanthomonas sp. OG2]MBV7473143.1 septal ring lytic transglycosylase RlpA family protein [Pseudoxanthomonas sp. PXM05]
MKWLLPALLTLSLAACSTAPKKPVPPPLSGKGKPGSSTAHQGRGPASGKDCSFYAPAQEDPSTRGNYTAGGLYKPGVSDTTPDHLPDLDCIAEPMVTAEARSPIGNRSPYTVLGKKYQVLDKVDGYVEQGTASYYGNKFHGRRTSNQEVYDMYAFTAAHKTLPLPSFARVTNLDNGQSVVVRVNDRGPFHDGRVIDLSYAAAYKLGITQRGTGRVEVRALTPGKDERGYAAARSASTPAVPASSGMDALVEKLPASNPAAQAAAATATAANAAVVATVDRRGSRRYQVIPDTKNPASADRFDAWMQANGVRVATGKPAAPAPTGTQATAVSTTIASPAPSRAVAPTSTAVTSAGASSIAPGVIPRALGAPLQLQVGSFASRENADRALARLVAAGIAGASLSDVQSNGRVLWRLRVGATDPAGADELAGRIAKLGFGRPQLVRD